MMADTTVCWSGNPCRYAGRLRHRCDQRTCNVCGAPNARDRGYQYGPLCHLCGPHFGTTPPMSRYAIRWNARRKIWEVSAAGSTVVLQAFDTLLQAERWACASDADRQAEAS